MNKQLLIMAYCAEPGGQREALCALLRDEPVTPWAGYMRGTLSVTRATKTVLDWSKLRWP